MDPKRFLWLPSLLLITLFYSCKKDDRLVTHDERTELNIAYGSHPLQQMDVYFPQGYSNRTPVVFLIHGGGFIAGTKEDFTARALQFRNKGYIVANLSHRLVDTTGLTRNPPLPITTGVRIADEVADLDKAVEKFTAMAGNWNAGTSRMYMAGHSAGAILSVLYVQGFGDYNASGKIRAAGNWAGMTDMRVLQNDTVVKYTQQQPQLYAFYRELVYRMIGVDPPAANALHYMAISGYWVANQRGGRATISVYPEQNFVLNYIVPAPHEAAQNLQDHRNFHQLLRNKGKAEKLVVLPGLSHGFDGDANWQRVIDETAAFFAGT